MRRQHHVFVGLFRAFDDAHRIERGLFTKQRRIEVEANHRLLVVLGETIHEAVVFARERDCRRDLVVGLEYFDRPPAAAARRCADARATAARVCARAAAAAHAAGSRSAATTTTTTTSTRRVPRGKRI